MLIILLSVIHSRMQGRRNSNRADGVVKS